MDSATNGTNKVSEIKPSKFVTIFAKFSGDTDSLPHTPKKTKGSGRRGSLPAQFQPVFPAGFTPYSSPVSSCASASIREGPMSPKNCGSRGQRKMSSSKDRTMTPPCPRRRNWTPHPASWTPHSSLTMSPRSITKPKKPSKAQDYLDICDPSHQDVFKKQEVDFYLEQLEKVKHDFLDTNNEFHQEITKVVDAHSHFAQRFGFAQHLVDIDVDSSVISESVSERTMLSSETESMYDIRVLHEEISRICEETDQESIVHFESEASIPSPQKSELELFSPYRKKTDEAGVDDFANVLAKVSERMIVAEKWSFDSMFETVDVISNKSESFEKVQIFSSPSFDSAKSSFFADFVAKVDVVDHKIKSLITFDPNVEEIAIDRISIIQEEAEEGNDSVQSFVVFHNPSIVDQTTNSSFSTVVGQVDKVSHASNKTMRTVGSELSLKIANKREHEEHNIRASLEVQFDELSVQSSVVHNESTSSLPLLERFVDKIESCHSMKVINCEHEIMERATAPSVEECSIAFPTPPKSLKSLRMFVPKEDGSSARAIIIGSLQFDVPDVPNPDEPRTPVMVSEDEIDFWRKSRRKQSKKKKTKKHARFHFPDAIILKNKWMLRSETN